MLHGPPGTGKSSFIKALAGALDYNICIIHLNESNMTDDRLNYLFSVLPDRSFLLLEDIDALFTETRQTFSGLLNALDGVGSSEERLVFMTTNHLEKIDSALLRPGRVDVTHYIGLATTEQIIHMFRQFYPEASPDMASLFSQRIPSETISPARIQGHFIMFKKDPSAALEQAELLLK